MELTETVKAAICAAAALPVPPEPLVLTTKELPFRLLDAQKRLATVAGYHGREGSFWTLWMATTSSVADRDAAVSRLTGKEGYWCAAWCFEHDLGSLGLAAHERYLNEITIDFSPNPFNDFVYAMEALRMNAPARAFAALNGAKIVSGLESSDEVFLAVLGAASGALPNSALVQTIARFGRTEDMLTRVALAVAYDVLSDRNAAQRCLAFLHRDTPLSASIQRTLLDRFGDIFVSAMAREPPVVPRRGRPRPSLMAIPGKKRTPHEFAPAIARNIACRGCGRPMRVWWRLDMTSLSVFPDEVRGLGHLQLPACFDCDYWMLTHEYRLLDDGKLELVNVDAETRSLAKVLGDYSERTIATQPVRFVKAPSNLHEMPLDGHCQLGGDAAWIQDPMDPRCPQCNTAMTFVFRFSSPNDFAGCPEVAGGSGALYYHVCAACRQLRCAAQWT